MKSIYHSPVLSLVPLTPQDILTLSTQQESGQAQSWAFYEEIYR